MPASLPRLLVLCAVAACASNPARTANASAPCSGQRVLEVRNRLEASVEVMAYTTNGGGPELLGTANAGTTKIPLFKEHGVVFAQLDGKRVSGRHGRVSEVTFTERCEPR